MGRKSILSLFLTILICIPSHGQTDSLKRVAILDVIDKENAVTEGVKMIISSKLSFAITNIPGYEGYDRVDIASILNEQEFQRSGLVSDSQIKRLGEMTGADYILVMEVAKLDERQIVIAAKILNVETARVENDTYVRTETDVAAMEAKCKELAKNLFGWTPPVENLESDMPFMIVERMPMFQGGNVRTFQIWAQNHVKYPAAALENGIQGKVSVKFIIERDGSLTNIEILRSPDQSLSAEVIRVLTQSPRWEPGKQRNRPVRVTYTLPIDFKLQ